MPAKVYPRLTDDQIELMISMRANNASFQAIADALGDGRTAEAIHWQCLKHGAEPQNPKFWQPKRPIKKVETMRGNHTVRRFTPEEDAQLLELEAADPPLKRGEIARRLNRKPHSVLGRLYTLASHRRREEATRGEE